MIKYLEGNCIDKMKELEDNSIDCVVSSPPYFGLRDYGTAQWQGGDPNCDHETKRSRGDDIKEGDKQGTNKGSRPNSQRVCYCGAKRIDEQFGLEKSYQDYIANTVKVFETFKPKLKDTATIWWNVGDSYNQNQSAGDRVSKYSKKQKTNQGNLGFKIESQKNLKVKDLLMIPNRVAIALQEAGWYIRSEIIWHKPNPMPESVRDRPTSSHEKIWLITKNKKYYYDAASIKEPLAASSIPRLNQNIKNQRGSARAHAGGKTNGPMKAVNLGSKRNKRNVWTVTTKPFRGAHFATFPKDLIEPCIKAGCPEKVCSKCKTPYIKIKEKIGEFQRRWSKNNQENSPYEKQGSMQNLYKDKGCKKDCKCETDKFESGIVLDPFAGAGTTGLVAKENNRAAILIELNGEYLAMAKKRIETVLI